MSISLDITATNDVDFSGGFDEECYHVIADSELKPYGLDDIEKTKDELADLMGKRPDKAWYKNPTKPSDRENMYTDFDWEQVTTHLKVSGAKVIKDPTVTQVMMSSFYVENNTGDIVNEKIKASVSYTDTVEHTSNKSSSFDVGVSEKIEVGIKIAKSTTNLHFDYNYTYGSSVTESESHTIELSLETGINLDPGESLLVEILCTQETDTLELEYSSYLTGGVALEYNKDYNGHRKYWDAKPINGKTALLNDEITVTSSYQFFMRISNPVTRTVLLEEPAVILPSA